MLIYPLEYCRVGKIMHRSCVLGRGLGAGGLGGWELGAGAALRYWLGGPASARTTQRRKGQLPQTSELGHDIVEKEGS